MPIYYLIGHINILSVKYYKQNCQGLFIKAVYLLNSYYYLSGIISEIMP